MVSARQRLGQSGISKKEYCRQQNLVYEQFRWLCRRLQEQEDKISGFIAIQKPRQKNKSPQISVVIGNIQIEVQAGVDEQTIKTVLRASQLVLVCE